MKLLILLVALSATFAVGVSQSTTGTCTEQQQFNYVANNLGFTCGGALGQVTPGNAFELSNVTARSGPLDTLCVQGCAGNLSAWLGTCCNDAVGASGLEVWCTPTGVDVAGRDRCYFALPPVFNVSNFEATGVCKAATEQNPCPVGCNDTLAGLAGMLGCCYQSFYNNSDFLQGIAMSGLITANDSAALMLLGNPFLWAACGVTPPTECGGEPFTRVDSADVSEFCPEAAETTIATTEGAETTIATTEGAIANVVPLAFSVLVLLATLVFII